MFLNKKVSILVAIVIVALTVSGYLYGYNRGFSAGRRPDNIENNAILNATDSTASNQSPKTVSLNAKIHFKRLYNYCLHTTTQTVVAPKEIVGLTKEELAKNYSDWIVTDFSKNDITLEKEIDSYCPLHYMVRDEEGYVAIYKYNEENDQLDIIKQTNIKTEFLPDDTKMHILNGIGLESLEEVEAMLESLDS
ncbi:hypothetical protein [Xylanivirga thermophila]|uniref:hypothetical protein n=1 Tax=Xylanivirga thermophila TaxID=2496273 RepID=UPI00101CA6AF|nr:hypothetical protein [Xylanivirga thermophila]